MDGPLTTAEPPPVSASDDFFLGGCIVCIAAHRGFLVRRVPFWHKCVLRKPRGLDLKETAGEEILCARGLKGHLPAAKHAGGLPTGIIRVLQFAPKSGDGPTRRDKEKQMVIDSPEAVDGEIVTTIKTFRDSPI